MTGNNDTSNIRQNAAAGLQKLQQTRWLRLKLQYLSTRGLTWNAVSVLINALLLRFVLPALPGITFNGNFISALYSALILIPVTFVTSQIVAGIFEQALRSASLGQKGRAALLLLLLGFGAAPGVELVKLKIITVVPGNLALHGLSTWIVASIVMLVALALSGKLYARLWPPTLPADNGASK